MTVVGPDERRPDACVHRCDVRSGADGEEASCRLVSELSGLADAECRVSRALCDACCLDFAPTTRAPNAVVASLLYEVSDKLNGSGGQSAESLRELASCFLPSPDGQPATIPRRSVFPCHWAGAEMPADAGDSDRLFSCRHPDHELASESRCRACRDWTRDGTSVGELAKLLPPPAAARSGPPVTSWEVAVTTAPRKMQTLDWCVDSLIRAGWSDPLLVVDGEVEIPAHLRGLQSTRRSRSVGAWPNYYLTLTELLMRSPYADAFMIVQDDALLADAWNVREYLEEMLWPDEGRCIVSLYCSENYTQGNDGWAALDRAWLWGALALVFPREVAIQMAMDRDVFLHRWNDTAGGLARIDARLGAWADQQGLSAWFPTPSLAQHVGLTSAIWTESAHDGPRMADWFAGDLAEPMAVGDQFDAFPEESFPPAEVFREQYQARVQRGHERMAGSRVAICGLARDVQTCLPRLKARIDRLGSGFSEYDVVIVENDSVDDTRPLLQQWQAADDRVHVLAEDLRVERYGQVRCAARATFLAACRNRYLEFVRRELPCPDYLIVVDTDIRGGWSRDGIASTFGWDDWDFVGACGLARGPLRPAVTTRDWFYFDSWAHRDRGCDEPLPKQQQALMHFHRGEPLVPVNSCFGGLGIYRMPCLAEVSYDGPDCEHVILHQRMRAAGFDRLFMNPDQLVLY